MRRSVIADKLTIGRQPGCTPIFTAEFLISERQRKAKWLTDLLTRKPTRQSKGYRKHVRQQKAVETKKPPRISPRGLKC